MRLVERDDVRVPSDLPVCRHLLDELGKPPRDRHDLDSIKLTRFEVLCYSDHATSACPQGAVLYKLILAVWREYLLWGRALLSEHFTRAAPSTSRATSRANLELAWEDLHEGVKPAATGRYLWGLD